MSAPTVPGYLWKPLEQRHDEAGLSVHDTDMVLAGVRALLRLVGEDPDREGLLATPERVLRAYRDLCERPGDVEQLLAVTFGDLEPIDQMIAVGPVEFVSLCEHHLLPFTGHAWVAYVPGDGRVVGLSKLARLVDHYARRPQVQERLTEQITSALEAHLAPRGSACVIRATHSCLALRGARKADAEMVTSSLYGFFKDDPAARAEFMALSRGAR